MQYLCIAYKIFGQFIPIEFVVILIYSLMKILLITAYSFCLPYFTVQFQQFLQYMSDYLFPKKASGQWSRYPFKGRGYI
jgi:hypothetical protein